MGNAGSVNQPLENAKKTGVCSLKAKDLREFPPALAQLSRNLRSLDVSYNRFDCLPPLLGDFTLLKTLNLANNKLVRADAFPVEFGRLRKLETLFVENNGLSVVPEVFKNLTSLKTINLEENSIEVFPSVFDELKKLEVLNLAANKLKSLPESVHSLSVVELNLNRNCLASLPLKVAQCRNLKVLRLAENCLPLESIHKEILTESSVSTLELEGNVFLMKDLHQKDGYEQFMERYTASKRKMY